MEQPLYLIINPLQIDIFEKDKRVSTIDKRFYEKIMWLKEISDNLKRVKIRRLFLDV